MKQVLPRVETKMFVIANKTYAKIAREINENVKNYRKRQNFSTCETNGLFLRKYFDVDDMRFWQKYLFMRKFLRNYVQSRSGCAREREKIRYLIANLRKRKLQQKTIFSH